MQCPKHPQFSISDRENIEQAVYFLKINELKSLCELANVPLSPSKQSLIDGLLAYAFDTKKQDKTYRKWKKSELDSIESQFNPSRFIIPGKYANNRANKALFKQSIGPHFSFTSYGMDWIREQWEKGIFPSYKSFEEYWQMEYERRKSGGEFTSAKTLQRVNYLRKMKNSGLDKEGLEAGWARERSDKAAFAYSALASIIENRNRATGNS
jgi:hypothetical protein